MDKGRLATCSRPRVSTEPLADCGCHHEHVALTVVIVDDHQGFRSFARALLEADGFAVLGEAEDGAAALAACGRLDPDVVLLDVVLPDRDGFGVCEHLVGLGANRPLVVLTSSRPASSYAAQLQASAARGFVPKEELSGERIRRMVGAET